MSLTDAILAGASETVQSLLESGADVNEIDEYGFTPLIEAVIAEQNQLVEVLLKYGARIDEPDLTGRTALYWAVDNHNLPLCEFLLRKKANPNAYNEGGQPILVYPLLRGQTELKKLLIQHGADLYFAQDFINTKLIGHRFNLLGKCDIFTPNHRFVEVNLEGFILEFTLSVVRYSLERYRNHFSARHLRSYFEDLSLIIQAFKTAESLLKYQNYRINIDKYAQAIDKLLDQDLLLLPVAYEGHAVSFIKYQDLWVRCDRGEQGRIEGSIIIYKILNRSILDFSFLKALIYRPLTEQLITVGIKQILNLKPITKIPLPLQITGNCSWANIEGAVAAMLFLLKLKPLNNPTDIRASKTSSLNFYQQWVEWDKDRALEECIQSFHYATPARKASKAALLGAILTQQCNHQSEIDLTRAEKILAILTQTDYQYVLNSYVQIYRKNPDLKASQNLFQLLELYGVSFDR